LFPLVEVDKQCRLVAIESAIESASNSDGVERPKIALAALDTAEVRPVDSGTARKFFLKHAEPLAVCAGAGWESMMTRMRHRDIFSRGCLSVYTRRVSCWDCSGSELRCDAVLVACACLRGCEGPPLDRRR
jgi:hypothetical protein